jgi:putative ABC transport system permease protein
VGFFDVLREAAASLRANPLRALLTTLGMVFGVGAVLSMLAIAEGGKRESERIVSVLGARNVIVRADNTLKDEDMLERRKRSRGLTLRDLDALAAALPALDLRAASSEIKVETVLPKADPADLRLLGVTASWPDTTRYRVRDGRFFSAAEDEVAARVAVLGAAAARLLYGEAPAIGQRLKIGHVWFNVVGVMDERPEIGASFEGISFADQNRDVYVPLGAALRRIERPWWKDELSEVVLVVRAPSDVGPAARLVGAALDRLHHGERDYAVIAPEELLAESQRAQDIFALVMGCIAGISLLVGGIGIMNIMLASVLERVREIGLRRAVGARRRDISLQFVAEAGALSAAGGVAGIALGLAASALIGRYTGWPLAVTLPAVFLSTTIAVAVGLLSGIWPARRAASMDPIEALRDPV